MTARAFKPGDRVRQHASDRIGTVTSFKGAPVDVAWDDEPASIPPGRAVAAEILLARHAPLLWQARQGMLDARRFVGAGGKLYCVGHTLRAVERELRERGAGMVFAHEAPCIDLLNITVQRSGWESDE